MLVAAGHEVTAAANGAEGLAAWRERGADLVLTDMQKPFTGETLMAAIAAALDPASRRQA